MLGFLTDMVVRGFWWAILANAIVNFAFGIIGFFVGKINKVFGVIVQYLPGTLFLYYIWNVRHGIGWLIFGIIGSIWIVISIISAAKKQ